MVTTTARLHKYDRLDMVKKLTVTGLTQPQAEAIAEETAKLGETIADHIMDEIDQRGFAKKTDLDAVHSELKSEINLLRVELTGHIDSLRTELKGDNALLKSELTGKIEVLTTEFRAEKVQIRSEIRESEERITKNLQLFILKVGTATTAILCGAMFSMFKFMI